METPVKTSAVDIIDNRIDPAQPAENITVSFQYFLSDSAIAGHPGKMALLMNFIDPYTNQAIRLTDPAFPNFIPDDEKLEKWAKCTVKEYLEFHTNL